MTNGLFITLEGIEGAGKSTQQDYIERLFNQSGRQVITTREPGGTRLGEELRSILLATKNISNISENTELLMMFSARSQHLDEVIRPAIERGEVVISDRFTDSSFAYQGGGRGVEISRIQQLTNWLHADCQPDLTFLFDLPIEIGLERAGKRSASDRFESEDRLFFQKVREQYLHRASLEPERIVIINADQDIESIQTEISRVLKDKGLL